MPSRSGPNECLRGGIHPGKLHRRMQKAHISSTDLAARLKIEYGLSASIGRYLSGETQPGTPVSWAIARILNCSMDDICGPLGADGE